MTNGDDAEVPGLPLLGNLLQLKEKKPYKTCTQWSEVHGPIYSIQLGSSHLVVLSNNSEVAKEVFSPFPVFPVLHLHFLQS